MLRSIAAQVRAAVSPPLAPTLRCHGAKTASCFRGLLEYANALESRSECPVLWGLHVDGEGWLRSCGASRASSRAVARMANAKRVRPKTECNRRVALRDSPRERRCNPNSAASAFRFRRVQCALFPLALPRPPIASTLATSAIGNERSRTRRIDRRYTVAPIAPRSGCTARASDPRTLALRNTCSCPPRSP